MTNESVEKHYRSLVELSDHGQVLAMGSSSQSVSNDKWFKTWKRRGKIDYIPTAERRRFHKKLLQENLARQQRPSKGKRAIIMAGPPGAGKSHLRQEILASDEYFYLVIDPDDFKELILEEMLADGTYEEELKPGEIKLREKDDPFFPLEIAALVHEESSILAKRQRDDAIKNGLNIVVDTVLSSEETAGELLVTLIEQQYYIEIVDLEATCEISLKRVIKRWREGYEKALAGENPLGGRWVPESYIQFLFSDSSGKSKSELVAHQLTDDPAVKRYRLYRAIHDETNTSASPVLEVHGHRSGGRNLVWKWRKMSGEPGRV